MAGVKPRGRAPVNAEKRIANSKNNRLRRRHRSPYYSLLAIRYSPARYSPASPALAARHPLDFGANEALDHDRKIVVEPCLEHGPEHFLDQIFERARVLRQHRMSQRAEG